MPAASSSLSPPREAARSAEADFARLFNLSLDLLCIAGFDGYFKRVNPSWTRVLGWSEAELLARPVAEFMHPDDRARTLAARAELKRGTPLRGFENRYLCKDGSYRWLSWESVAEPEAATVFAVARDVTERRRLDHEQLVLSKLESTGVLAGGIAHDFNNLLTSLALTLDMVRITGGLSAEQYQYVQQARHTVNVAKSLTDRLIAFAGGGMYTPQVVRLHDLLRSAFEDALLGANVERPCAIAADLWPVEVDTAQFAQVIRNVVLNAREAAPAGGTVALRADNVTLAARPAGDGPAGECVRIRVSDNGPGIAADVLPKVFDPYFSTKERGAQKGMGLGLTICRAVLQRHGGAITVESEPQRGTVVACFLPAKQTSWRAAGSGACDSAASA